MPAPSPLSRRPLPGDRPGPGAVAHRWPVLLLGLIFLVGLNSLPGPILLLAPAAWAGAAPVATDPAAAESAAVPSAAAALVAADSTAADSTAADSSAAPALASAPPESLWAVPLGRLDTLEGARERQAALQAQGIPGFARVRADSSGYWYEVFAGPVTSRAAADSLAGRLRTTFARSIASPVRGRWGELVLGAVTPLPPAPAGARPAVAPPGPPATGEASAAKPAEAQSPIPRVLELKKPVYSDAARERALSGTVKIRVLVGEDGQPRDFNIVQPVNPLLDGPALEAAAASRYAPAEADGRPVAAWIELSFTFP